MIEKALKFDTDFSLSLHGAHLELLTTRHADGLAMACQDGKLWELNFASTPTPDTVQAYIHQALTQSDRVAFAVIHQDKVIGTTSYHDILPKCQRLEIGYTWYAKSYQRTHVNTTCKLLLLGYAFDSLHYQTVGLGTDLDNIRSQTAIERLGAKKDGIIRGHRIQKDGTISNTVMYSISADEWPDIKSGLTQKLAQYI